MLQKLKRGTAILNVRHRAQCLSELVSWIVRFSLKLFDYSLVIVFPPFCPRITKRSALDLSTLPRSSNSLIYVRAVFSTAHIAFASCKIVSAAFMLIIKTGMTGKPPGIFGNTLASTTLNPVTPLTLNFESSTAIGSPSAPMEQLLLA